MLTLEVAKVFGHKIDFPRTRSDNFRHRPRAMWLPQPLVFVETAAQSSSDQRRRDCFVVGIGS